MDVPEQESYEATSTIVVNSHPKKPPAESLASIRVRSLVISSFWVIIILGGFPVWWWTTSIHRENLPLQEMLEWADGKVRSSKSLVMLYLTHNICIGVQTYFPITDCY